MSVAPQALPGARPARAPGRPRDPHTGQAILQAALELLADKGLTGLSIEDVATRAGVGKATIYRRWEGKDELVADALGTMNDDLLLPDRDPAATGSSRQTLTGMLDAIIYKQADSCSGRLFPRLLGHAKSNPDLFAVFYDRVIEPRRAALRGVVEAAQASGEIGPIDSDLAITLLLAPVAYRNMMAVGGRDPAPGATTADLVDAVLDGLAPR